ncbi:MAG: tetratricopeptide repeat protein [Planctomycetota bacterium]
MSRTRFVVTFVADPSAPAARHCAELAASALASVARVRLVPVERLIGRDLRECDRFVTAGRRTFAAIPHLRELATQCRDKAIGLLLAGDGIELDDDSVAALRRHCGRVATDDRTTRSRLRERLLAPVHEIDPTDAAALWKVLSLAPGADDGVETHLQQAQQWLAREDQKGAFSAAARALQLAPDQPGIIADVARLLSGMGQPERAVALCRKFLAQRPDAVQVSRALDELAQLR